MPPVSQGLLLYARLLIKGPAAATNKKTSSKKKAAQAKNVGEKRPRSPSLDASEVAEEGGKRAKTAEAADLSENDVESTDSDTRKEEDNKSIFSGKFDLYAMVLPFLSKVYLPTNSSSTPQYEELYKTILTYQAKSDFSVQIVLPDAPYTMDGVASSPALCDPMECLPYDLCLEDIKAVNELSYTKHQESFFLAPDSDIESGPAVTANTGIVDGGCGIQSARGKFTMKRVWTKANPDGSLIELFEGFFSLMISYSSLYRRKGHGNGDDTEFAFWAVRARKDANGKEIGLSLGT
ncbi:uncharacterized protein EV420DRAFT_1483962 [Desarmillaria tabescens]|uniref:Uncharacterized protein n=1 Tax=Armillaria tabescens TaxID=1929756 RepID=A0AA39JPG6_ARMTA|nr:uncharacterized protein EV420DRAFT_1483962 [Desarmillaria tabescens]KAK0446526.1 hypothetical protein EV420DRAFT_1483962 [Desarmillaria tabescens]